MIIQELKHQVFEIIHLKMDVVPIVEYAKKGDAQLACPLFHIAKEKKTSPQSVFDSLEQDILALDYVSSVSFDRGFLNVYVDGILFTRDVLKNIVNVKDHVGQKEKVDEVIAIDYSSPNIAKRFSVGHIRSTVIGAAIKRIYELSGYQVEGINHLGDWGTQFGKMIYAYEHYGHEDMLKENPIQTLQELYVKFHEEEALDPSLTEKAKDIFKAMEDGHETYLSLWKWFKDLSMEEFNQYYALLGVSFDHIIGESFYESYMKEAVLEMEQKHILEQDDDAMIIRLDDDMPPALIKKNDGSTLYMTRDVAAAIYRRETLGANTLLYVVGNEQALHFKQLQKVLDKLGRDIHVEHVHFGLVLQDGKKMSTRKGGITTLSQVFDEAIALAKAAIEEKNPKLENKDEVAKAIAVSAIIYNDLKQEKHLNVDFNLQHMLKFEGQTGPYIQYTSVRMAALLRQLESFDIMYDEDTLKDKSIFDIVMLLAQFDDAIERAKVEYQPSVIARYAFALSQGFNSWYGSHKLITTKKEVTHTHLTVVLATRYVLNQCMRLLGLTVLDYM
jgi:arginyl-tRNA synthetase